MKIKFMGAVEEVTGSRYLIENADVTLLVDCGLFQGIKEITQHNWDPFPVDPSTIDVLVLTHAHIDHSGYIPRLVKNGFRGKIYCSKGTYALCELLLRDSGSMQEEEAKRNNTQPLYTTQDAEFALSFFQISEYDTVIKIGTSLQVTIKSSHHIIGSSFIIVSDGKRVVTFSGDLGRPHRLIMKSPPHLKATDYLVLESTYGDRLHEESDPLEALADIIHETINKRGMLIIPAFAVDRTQSILYCLYQLKQKKAIPDIPIFLDSPLAIGVTHLLCQFNDEHTLGSRCDEIFNIARYTPTVEQSKHIDLIRPPAIIIAGSGMADGGRVQHHLKHFISNRQNTVLFVGYQAPGTKGYELVHGARELKIHGKVLTVAAEIKTMNLLSAHADYKEILDWLGYFEYAPKKIFITHGEIQAAQSLKKKIEERFGWSVIIPRYLDSFDLD